MSDLLSGTRVRMASHPDLTGWTEFPEPDQTPPDTGMVLVLWDRTLGGHVPVWEYVTDLTTD